MAQANENVLVLLQRMRERNDADPNREEHECFPPDKPATRIATLDPQITRPLSPMVQARFDFAGAWKDARLSRNWLSLAQIAHAKDDPQIAESIAIRRENSYGDEPPGGVAADRCAIFAHNPYELDETYLVWTDDNEEPVVWEYFGGDVSYFANLESYLSYIVGNKETDDR